MFAKLSVKIKAKLYNLKYTTYSNIFKKYLLILQQKLVIKDAYSNLILPYMWFWSLKLFIPAF